MFPREDFGFERMYYFHFERTMLTRSKRDSVFSREIFYGQYHFAAFDNKIRSNYGG
jgi:hypothetical protein